VRAGFAPPSVADEQAVRRAMGDARKICYSTGPSGDHLKALCEKWAIPLARTLVAPPGAPVATLVAKGDADLGFQQLSELIGQPGIEVGRLPSEIQAVTVFSAGISINSRDPEAARALIAYLASVETDGAKRRHGMQPA
jgi:molybdate transport system substrate-binding protein